MTLTVWLSHENDEGEYEEEAALPMKFEACPTCSGKGRHVNPSIDSHGISPDEFREDPGFEESYFRGDYDVSCYECQGKRVSPVVDAERCDPKILKAWRDHEQGFWDTEREMEAERRFGC